MIDLEAALGPVVAMLDPRPAEAARREPVRDSACIPFAELAGRMHELPPRHRTIRVVDVEGTGREVAEWLRARGRQAECVSDVEGGLTQRGRLWEPNPFLIECLEDLEPGRACDFGCGAGREAVALAGLGWEVDAIDRLPDALEKGRDLAWRTLGPAATRIAWRVVDLEAAPFDGSYDLVTALFFFDSACVAAMPRIVKPSGRVVVEAFSRTHMARHGKPKPERATDAEEVRRLLGPLKILSCHEAEREDRHTVRVLAKRDAAN